MGVPKGDGAKSSEKGASAGGGAKGGKGTAKGSSKNDSKEQQKGTMKGSAKGDGKELRKGAGAGTKDDAKGKGPFKGDAKGKGPSKGDGKGKGKGADKGKGKVAEKGGRKDPELSGAKTVQEIEADILKASGSSTGKRGRGSEESTQPLEVKGTHCEVRKHTVMGCAVVTLESEAVRDAIMAMGVSEPGAEGRDARPKISINDVSVEMRPHTDKATQKPIVTDIFIAWGRQVEKQAPLAVSLIADAFDELWTQVQSKVAAALNVVAAAPATNVLFSTPGQLLRPPMVPGPMAAPQAPQPVAQPQQALAPNSLADFLGPKFFQPPVPSAHLPMRAEAPSFMPLPGQPRQQVVDMNGMQPGMRAEAQSFLPPAMSAEYMNQYAAAVAAQQATAAQQAAGQSVAASSSSYFMDPNSGGPMSSYDMPALPERKPLKIVDPKSGEAIQPVVPNGEPAPLDNRTPKKRQPLAIVDPNSGASIDTLSMHFTPPKPSQPLQIIDPRASPKD